MDKEFFDKLYVTFIQEAEEHLTVIGDGLIALEKKLSERDKTQVLEIVYRAAHSLKGASRAVDIKEIELLCHDMEGVFASVKKDELALNRELLDLLHKIIDGINDFLHAEPQKKKACSDILESLATNLLQITVSNMPFPDDIIPVNSTEKNSEIAMTPDLNISHQVAFQPIQDSRNESEFSPVKCIDPPGVSGKYSIAENIKISSAKLDKMYLQTEELVSSKIKYGQLLSELSELLSDFNGWKREWQKHSSIVTAMRGQTETEFPEQVRAHQQQLEKILDFLEWNNDFIVKMQKHTAEMNYYTGLNYKQFSGQLDYLLDEIKEIMMLPFSHVTDFLPKMIRDLARDLEKEVDFTSEGTEIEVDKRILEELKDPIIHLIRNAIDHGIEKPAGRLLIRKPRRGAIHLKLSQIESGKIEIELGDDGAGIDTSAIKTAAVRLGFISKDSASSSDDPAILDHIFKSGISTSRVITDISGRGLGMAIVKEKIEKLGGSIKIETMRGEGTKFLIMIPVSLATMRGLFIRCADQVYILPTTRVDQIMRVNKNEIKTIENRPSISLNGLPIAIVSLQQILEIKQKQKETKSIITLFVLQSGENKIGFIVDEILDENEIVVKSFNKQLQKVKNIAGATISGDGKVIPILDTTDLMNDAMSSFHVTTPTVLDITPGEITRVLVVDDSITSRMLVKDILETAGYHVTTAFDGVDALEQFRKGVFHAVVSDVEMPRMNGFELTMALRKESRFREVPIILVTALSKREDREKGILAGANAYIVKSSFEQGNLIETLNRLVI